jgi:outer membrane protein TolC
MHLRVLAAYALLLCCCSAAAWAEEQQEVQPLVLFVERALAANPEIHASEARWRMYSSKARQSSSLDDPMLMFKMQNYLIRDPFNAGREPMTSKVVGLSQQLPFWGKRDLKQEMADREAESYQWQLAERKLELASMVKDTWSQLYLADRELETVARNIGIMDDFIALAETRYSVGQAAQQDILRAQLERSRMLDMQISLTQRRTSLLATFNSLLARAPDTAVATAPSLPLRPVAQSIKELTSLADEHRPLLKSFRALKQKSAAGHRLAQREFYPDFNLSLEYMQRDRLSEMEAGYDMYTLGLTINLPLQRERRQAMASEASSEGDMATAELESLRNSISQGIADSLARLQQREKQADLYRTGIIPQSEQSLESAVIGYRVGKVDFLTLLENRLVLFNYERQYHESVAEHAMVRARLEALVGMELE